MLRQENTAFPLGDWQRHKHQLIQYNQCHAEGAWKQGKEYPWEYRNDLLGKVGEGREDEVEQEEREGDGKEEEEREKEQQGTEKRMWSVIF